MCVRLFSLQLMLCVMSAQTRGWALEHSLRSQWNRSLLHGVQCEFYCSEFGSKNVFTRTLQSIPNAIGSSIPAYPPPPPPTHTHTRTYTITAAATTTPSKLDLDYSSPNCFGPGFCNYGIYVVLRDILVCTCCCIACFCVGIFNFVHFTALDYLRRVLQPCQRCTAPYSYRNVLPLTQDLDVFRVRT